MATVFDLSDIAERAIKTAVEAFIVALPVVIVISDLPGLVEAAAAGGIAAGSAAISVVLNKVLEWARSEDTEIQL
jgi:hypothetical protein